MFAAVLAALATVGTGLVPAVRAVGVADLRARSGIASSASAAGRRLQRAMCIVQVALAMTLVIAATLLGPSLVRLLHTDLGVSTDHAVTASMNMAIGGPPRDVEAIERVNRVIERIGARPGVRAVGAGRACRPTQPDSSSRSDAAATPSTTRPTRCRRRPDTSRPCRCG